MELLPKADLVLIPERPPFRVGVTLLHNFTLTAFAGFVDALRLSSDIGDRSRPEQCRWSLIGADRHPVASSCGASVPHNELFGDPRQLDYLVVVGGLLDDDVAYDRQLLDYIRRAALAKVTIVGLCTGVFALAQAGVLDRYRFCVHGYHLPDFVLRFPSLKPVSSEIFVVDRDRITCAGGTAVIDVAGHIIAERCGADRARKILPHLLVDELRPASHPQLSFVDDFFKIQDGRVREAIFLMQQSLSSPITIHKIAKKLAVPERQLERGFQKSLSVSPSGFYRAMRLQRARWLLVHSSLSVTQISVDCGFADTSHLARSFKRQFGELPTALRRSGRAAAASPVAVE